MTVLKSLFAYAGKYKYLTILSLVFSMISAILLLMPFIMIWKVIEVILAEYPKLCPRKYCDTIRLVRVNFCCSRNFYCMFRAYFAHI